MSTMATDPKGAGRIGRRSNSNPPFYLGVMLWGEEFCRYFLEFCIASLLSPRNIPAIENLAESRCLIYTTAADWAAMQSHPTFHLLQRYLTPQLLEMPPPDSSASKMQIMSRGHKALAEAMCDAGALGMFLYPDTVFSDGVIVEVQRRWKEGKRVFLAHCPRLANEGFLDALVRRGQVGPGKIISLTARELYTAAFAHLHSEHLLYEWDQPHYYSNEPSLVYWRVAGGKELLVHSLTWAPLLVDYRGLKRHDTWALDNWTIDGDYIHRNFPDDDEIYAEFDCDRVALISFTPESRLTYFPLKPHPDRRLISKLAATNAWLHSPAIDSLKRRLFRHPVRMTAEKTSVAWMFTRVRSAPIIFLLLVSPVFLRPLFEMQRWFDRAKIGIVRATRQNAVLGARFLPPAALVQGDIAGTFEFSCTLSPGLTRTVLAARRLVRGRWYWEISVSGEDIFGLAVLGVASDDAPVRRPIGDGSDWGWRTDGHLTAGGSRSQWGEAFTQEGTVMVAVDVDAGLIWFGKDGVWFDGGNPSQGKAPAPTRLSGPLRPALSATCGNRGGPKLKFNAESKTWVYPPPRGFAPVSEAELVPQRSYRLDRIAALFLGILCLPLLIRDRLRHTKSKDGNRPS